MAAVNDKYVVVGQPDGFTDANVVRSRVFKQTSDNFGTVNDGDKLDASVNYAVAKFPPGFIPRSVVVNVIKPNASAATLTVQVAKNATDLTDATLAAVNGSASTAALGTAGQTLIEFASATSGGSTTGTDPFVTGKNDYLVVTAGAAADARFEVVVMGDWPELTDIDHLPKLA